MPFFRGRGWDFWVGSSATRPRLDIGILKGPRTKLDRANTQASVLHDELLDTLDPKGQNLRIDFEDHRHDVQGGTIWEITAKVGGEMPQLADDFGLRLGECLHNFRGALDHTAWWLVRATKTKITAEVRKRVQFPMANSREKFWKGGAAYRLPGVSRDFLTIIERYQPYGRSMRGRAIRFLRDLTNLDKHRAIIATQTFTGRGDFNLSWTGGKELVRQEWLRVGRQVKRGTKIATLVLASPHPLQPEVTVNGTIDYAPAFPRSVLRPYADRIPIGVRIALEQIGAACNHILPEIEARL